MQKPRPYSITPAKGQALLTFQGRRFPEKVDLFETDIMEEVRTAKHENTLQYADEKETQLNTDFRNLLIHGDCLSACAYLKSQNIRIDLVYIDPPFASGANYAKKIYLRNTDKSEINGDHNTIGEEIMYGDIWQKEDYLNWLYERLLAIKDVMSETASIYVHLDWHIGHYVKIMLDEIFGEENFVNEIVWYYPDNFQGNVNGFATNHNTIFYYSNSDTYLFNKVLISLDKTVKRDKRIWSKEFQKLVAARDNDGKIIYEDYSEKKADDVWQIGQSSVTKEKSKEFIGYATQKPEELLRRVIEASSLENMIIADFFSGSGTTAKVANDLNRKFIACDVGINAIQTTRDRLAKAGADFDVLKVNDGLRLFRNPAQTTAKIFGIIEGFKTRTELQLAEFWDGGIAHETTTSYSPVKFSGIHDKLTKELLDVYLEEIYKLEDISDRVTEVKIIYAHKELEINQKYVNQQLNKAAKTDLKVRLVSLDSLLDKKRDALFSPDNAEIAVTPHGNNFKVEIKKFYSPYLKKKLDDYNAKKTKQGELEQDLSKAIQISESGLELIESVQFDTTFDDVWISNPNLEDKAGVRERIKGEYILNTNMFKIKIRNIAGDEIVIHS